MLTRALSNAPLGRDASAAGRSSVRTLALSAGEPRFEIPAALALGLPVVHRLLEQGLGRVEIGLDGAEPSLRLLELARIGRPRGLAGAGGGGRVRALDLVEQPGLRLGQFLSERRVLASPDEIAEGQPDEDARTGGD